MTLEKFFTEVGSSLTKKTLDFVGEACLGQALVLMRKIHGLQM
jgi:hypothetical protein